MALTRSLIVYNGSDSSPATDFTDRTDWQQTELASMANLGEAAAGQWLLRDEGGTFPDYVAPGEFLDAHNVLIARVGSNILFRGRIAAQGHFRGRQKAGRASEWNITLEDQNSHLRGIVVHQWVRPAETDAARAQGLVASYLSGSPRGTTNLNGSNLIITGSNLISLPAKTYSGVTPFEIMGELAANGDKETFVSVDNELALFGHDYTGYASLLRISDDPADANSTTYAPWDPRADEFGRQKLSALRVYYGSDVSQSSTQITNSNAPQFDYWEDVFWDSESTTAAQAIARAQKQLDYRSTDDISYSCAIGPMSGDEIWKIKPGQQIQLKARAARGGRGPTGTYTGDSFLTTRIRELRWTTPAEDQYIAHLELERPKRIGGPSTGSQALTVMPTQAPVCSTDPADLVATYDALSYDIGSQFYSGYWSGAVGSPSWTAPAPASMTGGYDRKTSGSGSSWPTGGSVYREFCGINTDGATVARLSGRIQVSTSGEAGTHTFEIHKGNWDCANDYLGGCPGATPPAFDYSAGLLVSGTIIIGTTPNDAIDFDVTWDVTGLAAAQWIVHLTTNPPDGAGVRSVTMNIDDPTTAGNFTLRLYSTPYCLTDPGSSPYFALSDDPRFPVFTASGDLWIGSNTSGIILPIGSSNTHLVTDGISPFWAAGGGSGGSVATDTIWDAAGDLAVGTGSDTAARLAIGSSNTHLVSNGTTALWTANTDFIAKSLIDAAGDLIIGLTNDNPTRLGIGASNTHLISDGVTPSWVTNTFGAVDATSAKASGTGDVTTTGSLQDLTGSTLSLEAGTYIVQGHFDTLVNNAANDKTFEGHLDVGGADENDIAISVALARVNDRLMVAQAWRIVLTGTTTVKLRAQHSGGTLGDFTVKGANTTIVAYRAGGGGFTNPMTTSGDLIRGGAAGVATRLAIGSSNTHLISDGSIPVWVANQGGIMPTLLNSVKASADTPDDEFGSTSLSGSWTVVDGSSGSVSLLAGSGAGLYDLTTRPGWILFQVGTASGDSVVLRQDYTLPDGQCIVACVSFAADMAASPANNEIWLGIGVNDNDTAIDAGATGQTALLFLDTDAGALNVIAFDGSATIGVDYSSEPQSMNDMFFFRIARANLTYHLFWSRDGFAWTYQTSQTMASAANNLWLFAQCRATMANRIVVGVPWFRQGTGLAVDPWPL